MRTCKIIVIALFAVSLVSAGADKPKSPTLAAGLTPAKRLVRVMPKVSLAKMPLERVLRHYEGISGLTIQADWIGLQPAGITKKTPVTLKAGKLTFEKLLDFTLDSIAKKNKPLAWSLSGSTIRVSTQMRILLRDRSHLAATVPGKTATVRTAPGRTIRARQVSFDSTPLKLVLEFIRDLANVNMHVNWRSLEDSGISKETPITVKVSNVSPGRLLDLTLTQLNVGRDKLGSVYWVIQEGVVHVATGDILNRNTQVQIYDVGDLLMVVPNFKGPKLSLESKAGGNNGGSGGLFDTDSGSGGGGLFTDDSDSEGGTITNPAELRRKMVEDLIEVIKNSIGEEMWQPTGVGSIKIIRNKMIIAQTPLGFKLLEQSLGN